MLVFNIKYCNFIFVHTAVASALMMWEWQLFNMVANHKNLQADCTAEIAVSKLYTWKVFTQYTIILLLLDLFQEHNPLISFIYENYCIVAGLIIDEIHWSESHDSWLFSCPCILYKCGDALRAILLSVLDYGGLDAFHIERCKTEAYKSQKNTPQCIPWPYQACHRVSNEWAIQLQARVWIIFIDKKHCVSSKYAQ